MEKSHGIYSSKLWNVNMSDLQITSLLENNTENPLNKMERIDKTSDLWLYNLKENTHTHPTTLFLRTAPDTKSWHSHVECVISDSSSVSTASVFGCCMNEVSWGKLYFVSVRVFWLWGLWCGRKCFGHRSRGGGETTCDNTGNLDYRCAQRARKDSNFKNTSSS